MRLLADNPQPCRGISAQLPTCQQSVDSPGSDESTQAVAAGASARGAVSARTTINYSLRWLAVSIELPLQTRTGTASLQLWDGFHFQFLL